MKDFERDVKYLTNEKPQEQSQRSSDPTPRPPSPSVQLIPRFVQSPHSARDATPRPRGNCPYHRPIPTHATRSCTTRQATPCRLSNPENCSRAARTSRRTKRTSRAGEQIYRGTVHRPGVVRILPQELYVYAQIHTFGCESTRRSSLAIRP